MGGTEGEGMLVLPDARALQSGLKINRKLSATKGSLEGGLSPTFREAQDRET